MSLPWPRRSIIHHMPVLTRAVGFYLSRHGKLAYAVRDSAEERDIRGSIDRFKLCATVDSETQALQVLDSGIFQHDGSKFFVPNSSSLNLEDLKRVGSRIEQEYQKIKDEKAGLAP